MLPPVLFLHSWLRWLVLAVGIALMVVAFRTWRLGAPWKLAHDRLRVIAVGLMDLQVVIGLWMYLSLSPIAMASRIDFGASMADPALRFFGVEHEFAMVVGLVVLHIGHVRAKRRPVPDRQRVLFITQLLWLISVLIGIPWPGLDIGRPLFRL